MTLSTSALTVRELASSDKTRWDDFVQACPEATFFHRAGWQRVMEEVFGHRSWFLYAERDGNIEGVLPLAQINSRLFGNSLMSLPFCVYGGVAANSAEAMQCLTQAAQRKAESLNVDALEMRNQKSRYPEWPHKDLYVTFRKGIDPDPEVNMNNIPRKQRAMVRKGIQAGLQGTWDDEVDRFYDAYSQSVHALGTPVFSRRLFTTLRDEFGDDCRILTITKEGRTVASVMNFYFRNEVLPYYGGGTAEARALKGNDFMYWELMRRSAEQGIEIFDFGRSKNGAGSYSFKKNWGFEPEPLHYEYHLVKTREIPEVNPNNPKYQMFIKLWRKMPLGMTQWLGPHIVRNLG
ncbi:MAG: FemAB family PEP-CTERM system-associated protein [Gammaproteobacteria bacterium]|nr:FemAB family PEP-CTERM system-associated protein [Gammaproteobacteria bacterium]